MVSPDPQDQRHRRLSAVSCIDDDANNAERRCGILPIYRFWFAGAYYARDDPTCHRSDM
jgi:hypothetical protein